MEEIENKMAELSSRNFRSVKEQVYDVAPAQYRHCLNAHCDVMNEAITGKHKVVCKLYYRQRHGVREKYLVIAARTSRIGTSPICVSRNGASDDAPIAAVFGGGRKKEKDRIATINRLQEGIGNNQWRILDEAVVIVSDKISD
jgi:hypothetical protein